MNFTYLDAETFNTVLSILGIAFGGGFMISVALHFIAYAVFGTLSLLNIKN